METLFTVRDVARIFGITESRVRYWAQTGFINPSRRKNGKGVYTFSDLVEMKAAKELLDAGISLQLARKNLLALREALPQETQPFAHLRIRCNGENLVVTDDNTTFNPLSGQLLLDFEVDGLKKEVAKVLELKLPIEQAEIEQTYDSISDDNINEDPCNFISVDRQEVPTTAYGWFKRGCTLDGIDGKTEEAIKAYQNALAMDPCFAAAHTNLGNIYYADGQLLVAQRCYEKACALDPNQAEAYYNLANIFEERGELDLAIVEYRRAINSMPDFADAHFNLALTLEKVGSQVQAKSHWECFLEMVGHSDEDRQWCDYAREHLKTLPC